MRLEGVWKSIKKLFKYGLQYSSNKPRVKNNLWWANGQMIETGWKTGSIPIEINNPDPNIPAIRYSHMNQNTHLGGPLRIRTDIERKIEMGLVMRIINRSGYKMQGA